MLGIVDTCLKIYACHSGHTLKKMSGCERVKGYFGIHYEIKPSQPMSTFFRQQLRDAKLRKDKEKKKVDGERLGRLAKPKRVFFAPEIKVFLIIIFDIWTYIYFIFSEIRKSIY